MPTIVSRTYETRQPRDSPFRIPATTPIPPLPSWPKGPSQNGHRLANHRQPAKRPILHRRRTETGKAASSRNALTLGLYTRADYVRPDERDLYKELCETLYTELGPEGLLEQSFVSEITGATWRLRRCSAIEADLADYAAAGGHLSKDPMLDESTENARRSIDRARAHAHSFLCGSVNQLRRLQTERACRDFLHAVGNDAGLADYQ